jgi:hypothetical protein
LRRKHFVSRLESDGETFDQRFNLRRKFFHPLQSNHETVSVGSVSTIDNYSNLLDQINFEWMIKCTWSYDSFVGNFCWNHLLCTS